jgi:hypothetical protein
MTSLQDLDYEDIITDHDDDPTDRPDDFMTIIVDKLYGFDWILLLIIAVLFLVVISDIYAEGVLRRVDGTFNNDEITTRGHLVQLAGLLSGSLLGRAFFAAVGV